MDGRVQTVCGHAEIEHAFSLFGRGRVLMFAQAVEGNIPHNGVLVSGGRVTSYGGPEIAHGPGRTTRLAVIVPDTGETEHFRPGDRVAFHERA